VNAWERRPWSRVVLPAIDSAGDSGEYRRSVTSARDRYFVTRTATPAAEPIGAREAALDRSVITGNQVVVWQIDVGRAL